MNRFENQPHDSEQGEQDTEPSARGSLAVAEAELERGRLETEERTSPEVAPDQGTISTRARARLLQKAPRPSLGKLGAGLRQTFHVDTRGYRMRRLLAAADVAAIAATFAVGAVADRVLGLPAEPDGLPVLIPAAAVLWLMLAVVAGLYHVDERRIDCSAAEELGRIAQLAAVWMWCVFLIQTLREPGPTPVGPAIILWAGSVPLMLLGRHVVRRLAQRRAWYPQTAMVVGTAREVSRLQILFARHPEYGIEVIETTDMPVGGGPRTVDALIALVERIGADRVIFASHHEGLDERTGALRFLAGRGVKVDLVPADSEVFRSDAELHFVEGIPFLTLPSTSRPRSAAVVKRAMDIGGSAVGLFVLSPVFAYCALRIKIDSRGPVFFKQPRTGRKGKTFELYKFRTMQADADQKKHEVAALNERSDGMFKIIDDPRITRFGAKLRRTSLDELPQLINVLRGEMSLVGPRPLIKAESDMVSGRYEARVRVRPGMTGPWQVLGRNHIPFQDMLRLDLTYVTNWSISDDIKLLIRTLSVVVRGRSAY